MSSLAHPRRGVLIIVVFLGGIGCYVNHEILGAVGSNAKQIAADVSEKKSPSERSGVSPDSNAMHLSSFDNLWTREDASESVAKRPFRFVLYAVEIRGTEAHQETWETAGYENTYADLVETIALDMHLEDIRNYLRPAWHPSSKELRNGMHLVPARLQENWRIGTEEELVHCREILRGNHRGEVKRHRSDVFDRAYCRYESNGRDVLLMRIGDGSYNKLFGICISLSSEESNMVENSKLDCLADYMDDLLHGILVDDPHAPYRIRLSRKAEDNSIELRARAVFPGVKNVIDSDDNPAHYLSALAGAVTKDRVVVVLPANKTFYYDVRTDEHISDSESPLIVPPMHLFDLYVDKIFDHSSPAERRSEAPGRY